MSESCTHQRPNHFYTGGTLVKRALAIVVVLLIVVAFPSSSSAARCTGSASCRACKTCGYCGHCAKGGGTCGVCSSRTITPPRNTDARTRTRQRVQPVQPTPKPVTKVQGIEAPIVEKPLSPPPQFAAAYEDGVAVFFSPHGYCTDAIVEQINSAKRVIGYRRTGSLPFRSPRP